MPKLYWKIFSVRFWHFHEFFQICILKTVMTLLFGLFSEMWNYCVIAESSARAEKPFQGHVLKHYRKGTRLKISVGRQDHTVNALLSNFCKFDQKKSRENANCTVRISKPEKHLCQFSHWNTRKSQPAKFAFPPCRSIKIVLTNHYF